MAAAPVIRAATALVDLLVPAGATGTVACQEPATEVSEALLEENVQEDARSREHGLVLRSSSRLRANLRSASPTPASPRTLFRLRARAARARAASEALPCSFLPSAGSCSSPRSRGGRGAGEGPLPAPQKPRQGAAAARMLALPKDFQFDFEVEQWAFEGFAMLDYRTLLELAVRGWPRSAYPMAPSEPQLGAPLSLLFSPMPQLQAMLTLGWCDRRLSERWGDRRRPRRSAQPCATPLHLACQQGHRDVAEWLLELGACPDLLDGSGMTPLSIVARRCRATSAAMAEAEAAGSGEMAAAERDAEDAQRLLAALLGRSRARNDPRLPHVGNCGTVAMEVLRLGRLCFVGRASPSTALGEVVRRAAGLPPEVLRGVLVPFLPSPWLDADAAGRLEALAPLVGVAGNPTFADGSFPSALLQAESYMGGPSSEGHFAA